MLAHTILRPGATELAAPLHEVMRLLRYREGRTRVTERDLALLERGIALARGAAAPAVSLAYCAVAVEGDRVRTGVPDIAWRSRSLARLLSGADGVTLVAATLGPGVEALTEQLFAREEYALATIVDAAGSALVHGLAEWVRAHLAAGAAGAEPTQLYGPGYGDWPVQEQAALVALAGGPAIGLSCTPTSYLVPQKSLVGLTGWLPQGGPAWPTAGCARCTLADCAYRVHAGRRSVSGPEPPGGPPPRGTDGQPGPEGGGHRPEEAPTARG